MDLVIQVSGRQGTYHKVAANDGRPYSIGRGFESDIILPDPYIGASQASCRFVDGKWLLSVTDFTNPVLLNGNEVSAEEVEISSGDHLLLGAQPIALF